MDYLLAAAAIVTIIGFAIPDPKQVYDYFHRRRRPPIAAYLTTDPREPPKALSTIENLLGVKEGMSPSDIMQLFGNDAIRRNYPSYDRDGWHIVQFIGSGVGISVEVDEQTNSTRSPHAFLERYDPEDPKGSLESASIYASLPDDLLLGYSTASDVLKAQGLGEVTLTKAWYEGFQSSELHVDINHRDWTQHMTYVVDHGLINAPGATPNPWGSGDSEGLSAPALKDIVTSFALDDRTYDANKARPAEFL